MNIAFAPMQHRVFLVAHGTTVPTVEAWATYLDGLEAEGIDGAKQLIVTDGSLPNTSQRRRLRILLRDRELPTALLCESRQVRRVAETFSWLTPRIRAFQPSELREALAHLHIPQRRVALIKSELRELQNLVRDLERRAPPLAPSGYRRGRASIGGAR